MGPWVSWGSLGHADGSFLGTWQPLRARGAWCEAQLMLQQLRWKGHVPGILSYNKVLAVGGDWPMALAMFEMVLREATPEVSSYNVIMSRLRSAWERGLSVLGCLCWSASPNLRSLNSALALLKWRSALSLFATRNLEPDAISIGSVQLSLREAGWHLGLAHFDTARGVFGGVRNRNVAAMSAMESSGWWVALHLVSRSSRSSPVELFGLNLALRATSGASEWSMVLDALEKGFAATLEPDVISLGTKINALDRACEWRFALGALDSAERANTTCYNSASSSCAKAREWQISSELLCSVAAAAVEGHWTAASKLLRRMHEVDLQVSPVTFGSLLVSYEATSQWCHAFAQLASGAWLGQCLSEIHCNAAISVCAKAALWDQGIQLLRSLAWLRIAASLVTLNSIISACEKGCQWQLALHLLHHLMDLQVLPDEITFNSALGDRYKLTVWHMQLCSQAVRRLLSGLRLYLCCVKL
eukprot:g22587.t1